MSSLINLGIGGERTTGCGSLSGYYETDFDIELKESSQNETVQASLSLVALLKMSYVMMIFTRQSSGVDVSSKKENRCP